MTLATEPLRTRPSRPARMRGPLLTAAGVTVATIALHVRDPHVTHSWGVCPLYALTGIYCPGCGGLRGVNDLTNGHVGAAASSNLLMVCAIPVAGYLFARWARATWLGNDVSLVPPLPRAVTYALAGVVAVFWVLRNVPGSWLAP